MAPTAPVTTPGEDLRGPAAEIHAGDDHVEDEEEEERIAGQIGEVDQQRQRSHVEDGLEEDVVLRVDFAGGRVGLVPEEGQVIADHGQGHEVERAADGAPRRGRRR